MEDTTQRLLIPGRLKVGFCARPDTYTKKLAFVIYFDDKGALRKEKSLENWRDTKIPMIECNNEPTEGFVLNKGVGGTSCGWNHRKKYIRVYDPRDFEIEVTVENLLFILRECDCSRGKGLEGKFVYAWDRDRLILLPVGSEDYRASLRHTSLQSKSVKKSDLIPGATYLTKKKQQKLIYLGQFDYFFLVNGGYNASSVKDAKGVLKRHIFYSYDTCPYKNQEIGFVYKDDLKDIAVVHSEQPVSNFAELVTRYHQSPNGSRVVRLYLKPDSKKGPYPLFFDFEKSPGVFTQASINYRHPGMDKTRMIVTRIDFHGEITLRDGVFIRDHQHRSAYPEGEVPYWFRHGTERSAPMVEPSGLLLHAELASGKHYRVENNFTKE